MGAPIIKGGKHAKRRINMQPRPISRTQIGNRDQIIEISRIHRARRRDNQLGLGRAGRKAVFKIGDIGFLGPRSGCNLGKAIATNPGDGQILDHAGMRACGKYFKTWQHTRPVGVNINADLLTAPLAPGNKPQKVRYGRTRCQYTIKTPVG